MSDVPPHVVVDILSHLPVKSLLRFRSVSRHFRALIDSPFFVNLHRQQQSMKTDKLLVFSDGIPGFSTTFTSFDLDSLPDGVELKPSLDRTLFPYLFCSCNGLICFSSWPSGRVILFWNPSTKRYREIRISLYYPPNNVINTVDQVGYDHVNDDYKVVRLTQSRNLGYKVFVYSLESNWWQPVEQNFPYNFRLVTCSHQSVFVSGAVHWLLNKRPIPDKDYLIVSFELASQSFQSVPQPECFNSYMNIDLGVFERCLCVVGCGEINCVDVWVMEEYGVTESWSKLLALTPLVPMMSGFPTVRPIAYLANRKELLLEIYGRWFEIYDLVEKKCVQSLVLAPSPLSTFVYQESLF